MAWDDERIVMKNGQADSFELYTAAIKCLSMQNTLLSTAKLWKTGGDLSFEQKYDNTSKMSYVNVYVKVYVHSDDVITLPGYIFTASTKRDIYSARLVRSCQLLYSNPWQKIFNFNILIN